MRKHFICFLLTSLLIVMNPNTLLFSKKNSRFLGSLMLLISEMSLFIFSAILEFIFLAIKLNVQIRRVLDILDVIEHFVSLEPFSSFRGTRLCCSSLSNNQSCVTNIFLKHLGQSVLLAWWINVSNWPLLKNYFVKFMRSDFLCYI